MSKQNSKKVNRKEASPSRQQAATNGNMPARTYRFSKNITKLIDGLAEEGAYKRDPMMSLAVVLFGMASPELRRKGNIIRRLIDSGDVLPDEIEGVDLKPFKELLK